MAFDKRLIEDSRLLSSLERAANEEGEVDCWLLDSRVSNVALRSSRRLRKSSSSSISIISFLEPI